VSKNDETLNQNRERKMAEKNDTKKAKRAYDTLKILPISINSRITQT
jgi:hypothetical protein